MKYYAVKNGLEPGIYTSWAECEANVKGFPGAQFKSFKALSMAEEYLGIEHEDDVVDSIADVTPGSSNPRTYTFCDGSYNPDTKTYGYGGFVVHDGEERIIRGCGDDPEESSMRNVAGEVHGAMQAVRTAELMGAESLVIYYDYMGIECWATGAWKANTKLTREYKRFMREAMGRMAISFEHVKGHSGVEGNERADMLAKQAVGLADGGEDHA